jgi:hypothetical protein
MQKRIFRSAPLHTDGAYSSQLRFFGSWWMHVFCSDSQYDASTAAMSDGHARSVVAAPESAATEITTSIATGSIDYLLLSLY